MFKVFISSTGRDLRAYRDALWRTISKLANFSCIRMEDFGAIDQLPLSICIDRVKECDVFVGITGHCYGSSPPGDETSFTEHEYDAALAANKPRLMFIAPEDFAVPNSLREREELFHRQQRFRQRVLAEQVVASFENPDHLAGEAATALANWITRRTDAPAAMGGHSQARPEDSPALLRYQRVRLPHLTWVFKRPQLEQAAIAILLDPGTAALVVTGLPGVGKTLLIRELAESTIEHFDYVLTMIYAGASATEPAYLIEEINEFLNALGRGFSAEALQLFPIDRAIGILVARLHGMRLLIVVDNADAAPPGQIEQLLSAASVEPNIRVAMSARPPWRVRSSRTRIFNVPLFMEAESRAFVLDYASRADLPVDCETLLNRVPEGVRTHPQALAALMASSEDLPLDLLLLDGLPANATAPLELIKALVAGLDLPALTTLALVEAMNGQPLLPALILLEWQPPVNLGANLRELASRALITRDHDVFWIPGIVADALSANAPKTIISATVSLGERVVALAERLCRDVDPIAFRQGITLVADIAVTLAKHARWESLVAIADERFLERANLLGCWREYRLLLKLCLSAAEQTGDTPKRVPILFRIAHKSLQLRDRDAGRSALGEIAAAIGETGSSSAHAELYSLQAFFAEMDKSDVDPISLLNASLTIHQAHEDTQAVAAVRCFMGNLYLSRKQFGEAKSCYETALALQPGVAVQTKVRVDAECGLALCNMNLGELPRAKCLLQGVVAEAERISYKAGLSQAHFYLALAADLEGNREAVSAHLDEAELHAQNTNLRVLSGISLLRMKQTATEKSA